MSQLTLSWQEAGNPRSRSFDLTQPIYKTMYALRLGRDAEQCDLVFDDPSVSRLHAEIRWHPTTQEFSVQNLRDINPIAVDGRLLSQGTQMIRSGTMIVLGDTTIQVAQLQQVPGVNTFQPPVLDTPVPVEASPRVEPLRSPVSSITFSHYLPLAGTSRELRQQGYLLPGVITVLWVVLMFSSLGRPGFFNLLLAGYLGIAGFYLIYKLCGKRKPGWVIAIALIMTPILLLTPVWSAIAFFFRVILPGRIPESDDIGFIPLFISFFFGAGLAEELLKAIPIFVLTWYGRTVSPGLRQRLGVTEPLDGIILGAASGLGFTLLETLGQYIPNLVQSVAMQTDPGSAQLIGLQLLIPRIVGSVFGHMAYSGYFGYYIGLSELKPRGRWKFLATGYLIASGVHAFWNASSALGTWALGLAGIIAYCLLIGAILKARQISPSAKS
ncbi:PrsW family glutamic-type intramembrane protease [Leptolyngbya sp. AN03gr2]|uniref:PrsW family glutamic-type intramembrane protease n=1 Tax=unclassified Leptolyngbya TaxID=2650499 RepID=UPI003D3231A9